MRLYALGALVLFLLWQGWRWGRGQQVWWVSVAVVVGLLAGGGWLEYRWQVTERAAAAGAAVVAGPDSPGLHCMRFSESLLYARGFDGYVDFNRDGEPGQAVLTYQVCQDLKAWLESDKESPSEAQVVAVHVVSHEAVHLTGERSEAVAECVAMKRDAQVAKAMGATEAQALRLASLYRVNVYPRMPAEYRGMATGC